MLTAVALWLLSGLAAPVPPAARHAALLLAAGLAVLRDTGLLRLPLPQRSWQVPQSVLHGGAVRGALRFGLELGTGVRTYLSATAPYLLALAVVLAGLPLTTAAGIGAGFGLGRALTPLVRLLSRDPDAWDTRLRRTSRPLATTTTGSVALIMAAVVAW